MRKEHFLSFVLLMLLAACAPQTLERGPASMAPSLEEGSFVAEDGAEFRLRSWIPKEAPRAILVASHGINDRAKAFELPGKYFMERGVALFAPDQRGFAQSPGRGCWPGHENLVTDLLILAKLLSEQYPGTPIYLLGESMGGGVALLAAAAPRLEAVEGAILVGPAAVAWETLPIYWRGPLWLLAHTIPWYPTSGRGLDLQPTDNVEVWHRMSADPDIIRRTRVDALYGLAQLTDAAAKAAPKVQVPLLVLHGQKDVFVRDWMFADLRSRLPEEGVELEDYEDGHHWLLRDHGAEQVYDRILEWLDSQMKDQNS